MTPEEKQLLLIDLCAREPYHPRIQVFNQGYEGFKDGEFDTSLWLDHIDAFKFDRIEILPYLRPIDTMTEDEKGELWFLLAEGRTNIELNTNGQLITRDDVKLGFNYPFVCPQGSGEYIDFLNAHHFDYRGLIEKGLALPAPDGMYNGQND